MKKESGGSSWQLRNSSPGYQRHQTLPEETGNVWKDFEDPWRKDYQDEGGKQQADMENALEFTPDNMLYKMTSPMYKGFPRANCDETCPVITQILRGANKMKKNAESRDQLYMKVYDEIDKKGLTGEEVTLDVIKDIGDVIGFDLTTEELNHIYDFYNPVDIYEADANALILIIENERDLYDTYIMPIYKSLTKKKKSGVYDPALAPKIFKLVVEEGAKRWYKGMVDWAVTPNSRVIKPTKEVKDTAMAELAESFERDYEMKAYDFMEDEVVEKESRVEKRAEGEEDTTEQLEAIYKINTETGELLYKVYKMPQGHFKVTVVVGSDEYRIGYTSDPLAMIKEVIKGYEDTLEKVSIKKTADLKIYHNPNYLDEYTVIIDGDVYSMSENALSPQGVNLYSGTVEELPLEDSELGEAVSIEDVPQEVQKAIKSRMAKEGRVEKTAKLRVGERVKFESTNYSIIMGFDIKDGEEGEIIRGMYGGIYNDPMHKYIAVNWDESGLHGAPKENLRRVKEEVIEEPTIETEPELMLDIESDVVEGMKKRADSQDGIDLILWQGQWSYYDGFRSKPEAEEKIKDLELNKDIESALVDRSTDTEELWEIYVRELNEDIEDTKVEGSMKKKAKEARYKSDEDIEKEFEEFIINDITFKPSGKSGSISITFPHAEESVAGGSEIDAGPMEVYDSFIIYDSGKIAFDQWYPEKTYNILVKAIYNAFKDSDDTTVLNNRLKELKDLEGAYERNIAATDVDEIEWLAEATTELKEIKEEINFIENKLKQASIKKRAKTYYFMQTGDWTIITPGKEIEYKEGGSIWAEDMGDGAFWLGSSPTLEEYLSWQELNKIDDSFVEYVKDTTGMKYFLTDEELKEYKEKIIGNI